MWRFKLQLLTSYLRFGRSLIAQRRQRGLAASLIDLSTVFGVGYFANVDGELKSNILANLSGGNAMAISEKALHISLHEAIIRGPPGFSDRSEVIVGIGTASADQPLPRWHSNPRFMHLLPRGHGHLHSKPSEHKRKMLRESVKTQMAKGSSPEQVLEILASCCASEIEFIMQISDSTVSVDCPLTQLGVDSLIAVEIRAWFFEEVGVNVPVLNILAGKSVNDLCKEALTI